MATARNLATFPEPPERKPRRNLAPIWEGQQYPKHDQGERMVRVLKIQGPEWVKRYRRWSIRLECGLTDEPGVVSYFMNMGDNREQTHAGRQSKYYKAWTMANGGPPRRGEAMDPKVFLDKFFRVRIEDCRKNSEDKEKSEDEVYSHITEILELVTP